MNRRLFAMSAALVLAACNGNSATPSIQPTPTPSNPPPPTGQIAFSIVIPSAQLQIARRRNSVSPNVQSAVVKVWENGAEVTAATANCAAPLCSVTSSVPAGFDEMEVDLTAQPNGAGALLAKGFTAANVSPNATANVSVSFQGKPARVLIFSPYTALARGTAQSIPVGVQVFDASGALILNNVYIGGLPFSGAPIALTNSDTSGVVSLSRTDLQSSDGDNGSRLSLLYNGGTPSAAVVTIGAAAKSGQVSVTPLKVTISGPLPKFSPAPYAGVSAMQQSGAVLEGTLGTTSTEGLMTLVSRAIPEEGTELDPGTVSFQMSGSTAPLVSASSSSIDVQSMRRAVPGPLPRTPDLKMPSVDLSRLPHRALVDERRAKPEAVAIGTSQSFFIDNKPVSFTLVDVSNHGYIWVENSFLSNVAPYAKQLGAIFDRAYAVDSQVFGESDWPLNAGGNFGTQACDSSGKPIPGKYQNVWVDDNDPGKVYVMVTDPKEPVDDANGFVSALDFMSQGVVNCLDPGAMSNEKRIFFGDWVERNDNGYYELNEEMPSTLAHEYLHVVNLVNHSIINGQDEVHWLNEGMGMIAEDAIAKGGIDIDDSVKRVQYFLAEPQEYSLTAFRGPSVGGYPQAYLLLKYLQDRFGPQIVRELTSNRATGIDNILSVTGQSDWQQLVTQFETAVALSGSGVDTPPEYTLQSIDLRHEYVSPYIAGKTYDLNGPQPAFSIKPGESFQVNGLLPGAPLFVDLGPLGGSGATVKVTDRSGFLGLGGTIYQQ